MVHAKGAGAYGEFEVTDDITDLTSAAMFNKVGKKTPALVRFSTVGGEKGSADSARDPRGFAIKFYTEEGNYDWVFNNTPIFFLVSCPASWIQKDMAVANESIKRDPTKFPSTSLFLMFHGT